MTSGHSRRILEFIGFESAFLDGIHEFAKGVLPDVSVHNLPGLSGPRNVFQPIVICGYATPFRGVWRAYEQLSARRQESANLPERWNRVKVEVFNDFG